MSLVEITQHDENIRNILEPPAPTLQPPISCGPCLYISKYKPKVLRDEKKNKECHKTFGYSSVLLPKPCEFLRKHSGIAPPHPAAGKKCCLTCRRPSLPACPVAKAELNPDERKSWEEGWKKGKGKRYPCQSAKSCPEDTRKITGTIKVCGKNFELENIRKVLQSIPRQPLPKFVDSQKGHTQVLMRSGLLPIYVHKKNYGKIPGYLLCRKGTLENKKDEANCLNVSKSEKQKIHSIPEEERQALLEGLRKNWNELQTAYQHMPILTDTMHKRLRKDRMEKELRQLEFNINTLERHDQIYVIDDE